MPVLMLPVLLVSLKDEGELGMELRGLSVARGGVSVVAVAVGMADWIGSVSVFS